MKKVLLIMCGIFIADVAHAADTCVRTTFNVTYSCGDGTLVGTLPENQVVEYGAYWTPTKISSSACTPPNGCKSSGTSFFVGNNKVLDTKGNTFYSFTNNSGSYSTYYYFTDDMTITPWYVCLDNNIASIDSLVINYTSLLTTDDTHLTMQQYDENTMTWSATLPYGTIRGVARKNNIRPTNPSSNTGANYIPIDQTAIENSENGSGTYCYCKMTEPYLEDNPWVYYGSISSSQACAERCVKSINYQYKGYLHSLFAAAIKHYLNKQTQ